MPRIRYYNKEVFCRLVIFDKDGTLIDFSATWVPLIRKRAALVSNAVGGDGRLEALLLRAWGIDPGSGRIDPRGPCPVSPRTEEIVIGTMVLYQQGVPWDEAKHRVAQAFDEADRGTDRVKLLKPVRGILSLLQHLKEIGFLLGLATNDERRDTEEMLSALRWNPFFDGIVCSGEADPPKPHPAMVLALCRRLSILPHEALFIGDTVNDMKMGKRAGLALTIGVLEGGVTPRRDLEMAADLVVDSFEALQVSSSELRLQGPPEISFLP